MKKETIALCVVGNFSFLRKHLNSFINQAREVGEFNGDILVLTSYTAPTFLIKLDNKKNIKFLRFNQIKFDKKTDESLKNINTNGQPNRHIYKKFQWHKIHLFDKAFKKWRYIFYMDINMTIHKSINPILENKPEGNLFANRDYNANEKWTLRNQFDDTNIYFSNLM